MNLRKTVRVLSIVAVGVGLFLFSGLFWAGVSCFIDKGTSNDHLHRYSSIRMWADNTRCGAFEEG